MDGRAISDELGREMLAGCFMVVLTTAAIIGTFTFFITRWTYEEKEKTAVIESLTPHQTEVLESLTPQQRKVLGLE